MTTNELRALRAMAMPRYALPEEDSPPRVDVTAPVVVVCKRPTRKRPLESRATPHPEEKP